MSGMRRLAAGCIATLALLGATATPALAANPPNSGYGSGFIWNCPGGSVCLVEPPFGP